MYHFNGCRGAIFVSMTTLTIDLLLLFALKVVWALPHLIFSRAIIQLCRIVLILLWLTYIVIIGFHNF